MQEAHYEKKRQYNGMEFPIECILCTFREEDEGKEHAPHYHEYIEFLYGLSPCCVTAQVAGESVVLSEGDLLVINSNVPHRFLVSDWSSRYLCIKALPEVIYSPENSSFDVKYIFPFLKNHIQVYQIFSREQLKNSRVAALLEHMMEEWTQKEYGYEIALKGDLLSLFLWIVRHNAHSGRVSEEGESATDENIRLVQRSLSYIEEHYAEINERQAAEYVNLSYSYYSKIFHKVMGKKFQDYLTAVRIRAAERLLLAGDMTVTEIALACGFSSSSHFIERFKAVYRVTPKQYRLYQNK